MSGNPPKFKDLYSAGIQSVLPMLYVAWADRVLSPSEVKMLRGRMSELAFLTKEDVELLKSWSHPMYPPSRELFQQWQIVLRNAGATMDNLERKSLVEMGLEMAQKSSRQKDEKYWSAPETKAALEEIQTALGFAQDIEVPTLHTKESLECSDCRFDVSKMTALLDDDYADVRNRMRNLLKDPVFTYKTLRQKEDYRNQVLNWTTLLAQQGLGALSYPTEYGGADSMGEYAAVFEMLGYHDLSLTVKFGVQFGLWGGSVLWLGTKKHHDKYLKGIGDMSIPGCFAMTETGHGSNVRALETTAIYNESTGDFTIHTPHHGAGKEYIGNALHGKMATVFVQLIVKGENHGVHALVVPLRDDEGNLLEGITFEDCGYKLGLNGVDNGRLWFDQVRVPRENLLNKFGDVDAEGNYTSPIQKPSRRFFTMLGTLVGGRVCVPRAGLSAAKSGLTIAIKYALKRRQFGPKLSEPETLLLDYPSHQRRLLPRLAKAYALDFGLTYLNKRFANKTEADIQEIETLAAALKSYATWFTTDTLQECREACGGKGYLAENRFADLKADSDIFTTFEGDNTVLMQLVAKGLLSNFKKQFHDDGSMAMLRFIGGRFTTAISERNPLTKRNTDKAHLFSSEFQLNAFRYREHRLLYKVADRIRGKIKAGKPAYDAVMDCQSHMIALGNAFAERIILEQFVKAVEACEEAELKSTLKHLCDLFALAVIEEHKGWYLEDDYMDGSKTKAIRRMIDLLCKEVRMDAQGLVARVFY